jgi:hypothetical protein
MKHKIPAIILENKNFGRYINSFKHILKTFLKC